MVPPKSKNTVKGKRQTEKIKQVEEMIVHLQRKSYVRKKGQVSMMCSICGLYGHYKRYHDRKDVPNNVSAFILCHIILIFSNSVYN